MTVLSAVTAASDASWARLSNLGPGNTVCDVKVMEGFGSSLEWMAFVTEWAIKLVLLGAFLL